MPAARLRVRRYPADASCDVDAFVDLLVDVWTELGLVPVVRRRGCWFASGQLTLALVIASVRGEEALTFTRAGDHVIAFTDAAAETTLLGLP